nr:MAG TPA: hypothetical protein [Caudoviricetes sp.]DAR72043.1 MAG TPA: hypothetical protein [Caudoviricetes sp.]
MKKPNRNGKMQAKTRILQRKSRFCSVFVVEP